MSKAPNYWWEAFVARPFGMPIPPNFFGLAAIALLGIFVSPGLLLVGAGLEVAYLSWLSGNQRFRNSVDARFMGGDPQDIRYRAAVAELSPPLRSQHEHIERRARDLVVKLNATPMMAGHVDTIEQLVLLHLRLSTAYTAVTRVVDTAREEGKALSRQEQQIDERLARTDLTPELRRSLEQQKQVIDQRQAAHEDAGRRQEHIDSELQRIDQQLSLIREQALLATDHEHLGSSLDALATSYNEASSWLNSQRDLIGVLDTADTQRLPARVLRAGAGTTAAQQGEST